MKILWLTWKDLKNPLAGGAETVNEQLAKRLVADGHEVVLVVAGFSGAVPKEVVNGYQIVRVGSRPTVYWQAYRYYKKNYKGWADLVIDEMNTIPFFAKFYVKEPNIMLAYQLCRKVWFYQMPLPVSLVGYLIEPIYLRLLSDRTVITESLSAKNDLVRYGFKPDRVHIISVGTEIEPVKSLDAVDKFAQPTLLCLGAMRSMKRTLHVVEAFELAKSDNPKLKLIMAGDNTGSYGNKVMQKIKKSRYASDIDYKGRVSKEDKLMLMRQSHAIMVASVKEGWGLIVTEANSQGTPAVVYDVDGLRDSVRDGETGLIADSNTPQGLADKLNQLLSSSEDYEKIRQNAWAWSKTITYEKSYKDLLGVLKPWINR